MTKIFLIFALIASVSLQNSFAQNNSTHTVDSVNAQTSEILSTYYKLKDALVSSNSATAALSANELVKTINATDNKFLNETDKAGLLKEVNAIAQSDNIKLQREKFATLSNEMFDLAKKVKLSAEPVYQQYCPMKKAYWLSSNKGIKNPYYGNSMLTCGSVKAIL